MLAMACKQEAAPAPTKVEKTLDEQKREAAARPKKDRGISSPDLQAPSKSDGPQIPDAEVESFLAEGRKALTTGDETNAIGNFRRCANREPASARCDGELGLLLMKSKRRRESARYYLKRAGSTDDPKATGDLYARVADALRSHGFYSEASATWLLAIAREDKAEYHEGRSRSLVSSPDTLLEAAEELGKANALQPNERWVYGEAALRGQIIDDVQPKIAMEMLQKLAETTRDEKMKAEALAGVSVIRETLALRAHKAELTKRAAAAGSTPPPKEAPAPQ